MNAGKCSQYEHDTRLSRLNHHWRAAVDGINRTERIASMYSVAKLYVRFEMSRDGRRIANLHMARLRMNIFHDMCDSTAGPSPFKHPQFRHHIQAAIDIGYDPRWITSGGT